MKERNFSIFIPKNDQCDVCCAYETGQIISEDGYAEYLALKIRARDEKETDKQKAIENKCYTIISV